MPFYVYKCDQCETEATELRSIAQIDEPSICGNCGSTRKRAMTAPAIVTIEGGGTRNHRKIKMWSLKERMNAQYGDNL